MVPRGYINPFFPAPLYNCATQSNNIFGLKMAGIYNQVKVNIICMLIFMALDIIVYIIVSN